VHPNWPLRWPEQWRDPGTLDLIKDTPFGFLLFPSADGYQSVVDRARRLDITICDINHPPAGVELAKGEWPGIRMAQGQGDASGGPTGVPWIDSNGWLVRLTRVRKPGQTVWVAADPPKSNQIVPLPQHQVAVADAAAHGGCWVVTLDKDMAQGLAAGKPELVNGWHKLMGAIGFFQAHREWSAWPVDAVLAVVSSFAGNDEFFSQELLNLTARTNVSYSIVPSGGLRPEALRGLRAVVYPDAGTPSAEVRQVLLDFVERGGLLIAGPHWGEAQGAPAAGEPHPRYALRQFGKGRIALAHKQPDDPYELAQDTQILVSHRYDLVRLFNGSLLGSYCTVSPDGRRRLAHVINYSGDAGDDPATAYIAGRYRSAKLWSCESAGPRRLDMVVQRDGIEVHLPQFDVYGGVELET